MHVRGMRRLGGILATLALLAVTQAAQVAEAAGSASTSCTAGDFSASDGSSPVAVRAGAAAVESVALTNTTSGTLTNASVIIAVIPPQDTHGAGAPQMSWRFNGGSWHSFGLSWNAPAGSGSDWQSPVLYFGGTFAPQSTHTLEIAASFSTASAHGEYMYEMAYSADPCGMSALGQNMAYASFYPGTTPAPKPSSPSTQSSPTHRSSPVQVPSSRAAVQHSTAPASSAAAPTSTPTATRPSASSSSARPSRSPSDSANSLGPIKNVADTSANDAASVLLPVGAVALLAAVGVFVALRIRRRDEG